MAPTGRTVPIQKHNRSGRIRVTTAVLALTSAGIGSGIGALPSAAQAAEIQGLWRGSGYMRPAEGPAERVRCQVTFSRYSSRVYGFTARCESQSASLTQTGEVVRGGSNSFIGSFQNRDYNISGSIRINVRGNQQSVTLRSRQGSGQLTLYRR
jgi:hypothetical protein